MPKGNSSRRVALRVVEPASDWLATAELEAEIASWIADGRRQGHAAASLANRRQVAGKLVWFLRERGKLRCGPAEVTAFLDYLAMAHEEGGRFAVKRTEPLKPSTLRFYWAQLRTLFAWLVKRDVLSGSPMERLDRPRVRESQIRPFTAEQVQDLFRAAHTGRDPVRDEAILLLLFDTGIRASELCRLTIGDFDLTSHRCRVFGKGSKERFVQLGEETRRAVRRLISEYRDPSDPEQPATSSQPVFTSLRGKTTGEALTRAGLYRLIRVLGKRAGIDGVRCSPHTLRHSFAISYLRNKGAVFALQIQLGHESLGMTKRYVNLADADLEAQHAIASPADHLFGRQKKR
jgi:site-specific recombinase XerD